MRLRTHGGCGCGDDDEGPGYPYAFEAYVPVAEQGARLEVSDGEEVLWRREASPKPPEMGELSARTDDEGSLMVSWSGQVSGESTSEVWLQWSDDGGRTWHGLITGVHDREVRVPTSGLPPGEVIVRALLHDGFDTVVSEPVTVTIAALPPDVAVLSPRDGEMVVRGSTVRLWGAAGMQDGSALEDEDAAKWTLDGKEVGRGLDLWVDAPAPGEHHLTLTAGESEPATVTFRVVDPENDFGPEGRQGS